MWFVNGKITALEVQQKNRERINVYLDEQFAFGLNQLDAARLRVGQVLSESEIEHLKTKDTSTQAFDKAVRFLAPRPRSRAEVRQQLTQKGFQEGVIDEVITRLEGLNYLDDLAFARFWMQNRNEFNPRGAQAIRYELRQKGIDRTIIDEVLAEFDSLELALRAAQKKMRSLRGKDSQTVRTQLGGFLTRRGFDYQTVRSVLEHVTQQMEAVEEDTDDAGINYDEE